MNMRELVYFGVHRAIGSRVRECFEEMLSLETSTPEHLLQLQGSRLEKLLRNAAERVPFYRERVSGKKDVSLGDFPILRKEDIRKNFLDLMTPELRMEYTSGQRRGRYSWVQVQTGGTTGVPTTVIHCPEYRDAGRAGRLYSQHLCGFPLGTKYFKLWGSMKEINESRASPTQRVLQKLHNETLLNAFRMSDRDIESYIHALNSSDTQHLMGYVDAICEICTFARRRKISLRPLKSIMACAGTVTPEVRQNLEASFNARVHNQYGSRDCAGIACECEHGGHHIYSNILFLEAVDELGRGVPSGHSGRLLVTLLSNFSFPLIRYEIGDVGALSSAMCNCGRPYPLLRAVEGRTGEFLRSMTGAYVSPVYIRHLVGVVHNPGVIRRFQLEQTSACEFVLRYELEAGVSEAAERKTLGLISKDLKAVLGAEACLQIEKQTEIVAAESGKFLYTKRGYFQDEANSVRAATH